LKVCGIAADWLCIWEPVIEYVLNEETAALAWFQLSYQGYQGSINHSSTHAIQACVYVPIEALEEIYLPVQGHPPVSCTHFLKNYMYYDDGRDKSDSIDISTVVCLHNGEGSSFYLCARSGEGSRCLD